MWSNFDMKSKGSQHEDRQTSQARHDRNSGRWNWPLPAHACFPGCSTHVCSASREWWEYAPSEAKPHPMAEGVCLRDNVWYWAVPAEPKYYSVISIACHESDYTVQVRCSNWQEAAELRERLLPPEKKS